MQLVSTLAIGVLTLQSLFLECLALRPTANCPSGTYSLIDSSARPRTRNCGTNGYLATPSAIGSPLTVDNLDSCVESCKSAVAPRCISLGYSSGNSSCVLYSKRLIDQGYQRKAGDQGTVFSNQACYSCDALTCSNTEAVGNGGFEDGPTKDNEIAAGWIKGGAGAARTTWNPHSGSYTILTAFVTQGGSSLSLDQTLQCTNPGLSYEFSAWVQMSSDSSLMVYMDGQVAIGPLDCSQGGCGAYKQFTGTITPTSTTPTLTIEVHSSFYSDSARIDDVSLTLITTS